jgi:hypothetical protein
MAGSDSVIPTERKPVYTVAFDSHDGYWWAITDGGKSSSGSSPVDALQGLLNAQSAQEAER